MAGRTLHMIGYGSVGGAFERFVTYLETAHPELVKDVKVHLYAPELTEKRVAGRFSFFPCPMVTRETLVPLLDEVRGWWRAGPLSCEPRGGERVGH